MSIRIVQLPALTDNYNYLLVHASEREAIAIDPSGENPVRSWLNQNKIQLVAIWNTHHHPDHTGGNLDLLQGQNLSVFGPASETIPGRTHPLKGGESLSAWGEPARVIPAPGHTLGHICYHLPGLKALFSGDVIFSAGCGRLFEGSYEQAFDTLNLLGDTIHADTLIYGAHEYSQVNTEFALELEPGNPDLQRRYREVLALRQQKRPTVPTTLAAEKSFNPFLRTESLEIRRQLQMGPEDSPLVVFTALRKLRDNYPSRTVLD